MRTLQQITEDINSERENIDYLETRYAHWGDKLNAATAGTYEAKFARRRLISLLAQIKEGKSDLRLLKIERDEAAALLNA